MTAIAINETGFIKNSMAFRKVGIVAILAASACLSYLTAPITFKKTSDNMVVATPVVATRIISDVANRVEPLSARYPDYFYLYQESNSRTSNESGDTSGGVYLSSINAAGEVEIWHRWKNTRSTTHGSRGFLLDSGYVLLSGSVADGAGMSEAVETPKNFTPGAYGVLQIQDVDGEVVWEHEGCIGTESGPQECLHHDIHPMENGNLLVTGYKRYSSKDLLDKGYRWRASEQQKYLLLDVIYEIRPHYGKAVASCPSGKRWCTKIMWRWELVDHVGDFDPSKITLNYINLDSQTKALGDYSVRPVDQALITSIDYDVERDEILLLGKRHNEVWIIDHSVSTASAIGKSGDLIYRWGNPANYSVASAKAKQPAQLAKILDAKWGQHSKTLLLLGNTALAKANVKEADVESKFGAEVLQVPLPLNDAGRYVLEQETFGPEMAWSLYGPTQLARRGHLAQLSKSEYVIARSPRTLQKFKPRAQDQAGNAITEQVFWTTTMPPASDCRAGVDQAACSEIADMSVISRDSTRLTNFRKRLQKKGLGFRAE